MSVRLPDGFRAGHWSDRTAWTGCTVVLAPPGSVGACEVRGGGPGTRESDLLSPAASVQGVNAVLLTGGSAFGLGAADGVARWLERQGIGHQTSVGAVPLVASAVVFDLALGRADVRPGPDEAEAACAAAGPALETGSVGAGTGCTVGKILGPGHWTKGGLGAARIELAGGASVVAIAVVNAFGDVVAEDGSALAGVWRDGRYERTVDLLRSGVGFRRAWHEATTLVCLATDAVLTKTEAWLVARAASAGVARAVDPTATSVDGDVVYCLASGAIAADPLAVAAVGAEATAAAIREGVRAASGAPGCPASSERG